jgi:ribosomal protein S24E
MGMFDDIHVEKLKVSAPKAVMQFLQLHGAEMPCDFQTKDLDCIMAHYTILANGQMMVDAYVDTGKTEPYVPIPFTDTRSFLERLYFDRKFPRSKTPRRKKVLKKIQKKVDYTKTFVMYCSEQVGGRYLSIDFTVTVVKGKVKSIVYLKHDLESEKTAKLRHTQDAQFTLKMDASANAYRLLKSRWYYPVLREVLNPAIFFTRLLVQKICGKVMHYSSHWHGV